MPPKHSSLTENPSVIFARTLARGGLRLGILCLVAITLITILSFGIVRGAGKLSALRGERTWITASINKTAKLATDHARANELSYLLKTGLPTSFDATTMVLPAIRRLAEENKVRAATELRGEEAGAAEPRALTIFIRADGSRQNLVQFLKALESQPLAFNFPVFNFAQTEEGSGAMQLLLDGKIYIASQNLEATLLKEAARQELSPATPPAPAAEAETAATAGEEILPANVTLELLNGSGIVGLAKNWQKQFAKSGFENAAIGNTATTDYTGVLILYKPSKQQILLKIREVFSSLQTDITSEEEQSEDAQYDIVIILGK